MLCCCGSDPCGSGGDGAIAVPPKAGFLVQTEALSRRLLLRAVRHPLLLMLHFGGAVAMAVCLGTIFQGKLEFTFDGAQSRCVVSRRESDESPLVHITKFTIFVYFFLLGLIARKRDKG